MPEHDMSQEGINPRQDHWPGFIQGGNNLSHFFVCDRQGKKKDVFHVQVHWCLKTWIIKKHVFGICLNVWEQDCEQTNMPSTSNSLMTKGLWQETHISGAACPEGASRSDRENTEKSSAWTNTSFHELCQCVHALDGIFSKQMITGKTQQTRFVG